MSRVRRYSRSSRTHPHGSSPTGLSPAPAGRSRTVPLTRVDRARDQSLSPAITYYPLKTAPTGSYALRVWAPPVSLAATPGILSVPRGTEMFQFPRCPLREARSDGPSRPPGCPIRRSRDYRVPAPPPRISLRGRVLPRLQAPRHPPSAHTCRASLAPPNAPPSPTRAHPCHQVRWPAPRHVTHVHLVLFASRHGLCLCVCNTVRLIYDPTAPACMPARIGGSGPLKVRAPIGLSKCGEGV